VLPARFEYHRPESLEEALSLLNEHDDAKVLSGGMSLIPLMKLRFAAPGHLVDINRIEGLSGVSESGGWLRIGALSRHNELAGSDMLKARYPVMAAAAPQIADPIVRNLGTIGGSLAHADPAGDWGSVMLAMDAQVVATGSAGDRTIAIGDLFESTFTTTLAPNEILTQVQVPQPSGRSGGAYLKVERKVGDFATVGVAVHLELDDGHIANTGIGLTAVGSANISRPRRRRLRSGVQSPPRSCSRKRGDWQLRRPILRPTSGSVIGPIVPFRRMAAHPPC